jgi:hypothetical protein
MPRRKNTQYIRNPFNQPGITLLFAFLWLILFTYPFLVFNQPAQVFYFLFVAWGAAIAALYLMSRKRGKVTETDENGEIKGDKDYV